MHGRIGILKLECTSNQKPTTMDEWLFFFRLGWEHILSIDAWDHLLFLACLGSMYVLQNIRQILKQVTVFAIGHTLSLILNIWHENSVTSEWVEFLIPLTIVITATDLFRQAGKPIAIIHPLRWIGLLGFGILHGLGFARTFRFLLAEDSHLLHALSGFTIGLELAQFFVIGWMMLAGYGWIRKLKWPEKTWIRLISLCCFFAGVYLCIRRFPI
jgi:hypothetical protein